MNTKILGIFTALVVLVLVSAASCEPQLSAKPRIVAEGGSGSGDLRDTTPPTITNVMDYPDPVQQGNQITVSANIVDNVALSYAFVELNGVINYTLTKINTTYYRTTSVPTTTLGTNTYKILAIDTSSNEVQSSSYTFVVTSTNQTSCIDTDGGINYFVKGVAHLTNNPNVTYTDYCLNADLLREYYCYGSTVIGENYSCSSYGNACLNGICVIVNNNITGNNS